MADDSEFLSHPGENDSGNSGAIIEGVGNEVVHALTLMMCFAVPIGIWIWQNRHAAFAGIHPAQLNIVEEVRRRLGFGSNNADAPVDNVDPTRETDPAGVPQPPPNIPRYQLDNTCPICFCVCRYAVLTNCGHRFCTSCIVTYWRVGRWVGSAVECPVCRVRVTLLLPDFYQDNASIMDRLGREEAVANIREYNRRFSGLPRSLRDYIRDAPVLLRHLWQQLFTMNGLMNIFRLRIVLCFAAMFAYVFSPFDIIPEAVFGLLGIVDDFFIIGMALFYMVALYRHYIGEGNVF